MSDVSVEALKAKCAEMFKQKAFCERLKKEKANEENKLTEMKLDIFNILTEQGLKNFDTGFGKVARSSKPYAKIVDKYKLRHYLEKVGDFDDVFTFNAASMNSYFNEKLERAKEEGDIDFAVDGMDMTSARETLRITGVKNE